MRKTRNEMMVGLFVIIGFALMSLVFFFVSGVYLFRQGYQINVMYDYVSILDKGAPVRLAGVRIGEISDVKLTYDDTAEKIRVNVKVFIEKGVEIRENYKFVIQGTHILSEPHIEIEPQPGNSPIIKDGKVLEGVSPVPIERLIEHGHEIVDNLNVIIQNIREAFFEEENANSIKEIVQNLASVTTSLETILTGSEAEMKSAIENIDSSTQSLRVMLEHLEKGEGTLGKLFSDEALYEEMRAFVAEIKAHPWKLMKKEVSKKELYYS